MTLSVIVPDKQPGMERMLLKELEGLNAEVIQKDWTKGLQEASGEFICLLEKDSAVAPGTIRDNLQVFLDKPMYRKLAMVSCPVDKAPYKRAITFTYDGGTKARTYLTSESTHFTRIGYVPGAIIRVHSLKRSGINLKDTPQRISTALSLFFWQNGLRILLNPETLYQAPENGSQGLSRKQDLPFKPNPETLDLWAREFIS